MTRPLGIATWPVLVACLAWAGCEEGGDGDVPPRVAAGSGSDAAPARGEPAQGEPPPPPELPPLASFRGTSAVVFTAAPDLPHTLDFSYVGADRGRWELRLDGATNRMLEYRFGDRFFRVEDFVRESVEITGSQRELQALLMDLRRAVFQWPHGFAWGPGEAEDLRVASVPALAGDEAAQDGSEPEPLGTLTATVDGDGGLVSILATTREGIAVQRLRVEAWREPPAGSRARRWPARLTLHEGDQAVWVEDVQEMSGRLRVKAGFFLPPDREHLALEDEASEEETGDEALDDEALDDEAPGDDPAGGQPTDGEEG